MITVDLTKEELVRPANTSHVVIRGDIAEIYLKDDEKSIAHDLGTVRSNKRLEFEERCTAELVAGFISNATGEDVEYSSDVTDQLNLMGAVIAGTPVDFKGRGATDSKRVYKPHTPAQIKQVYADGLAHKNGIIKKRDNLNDALESAVNADAAELVNWD